MEQQTNQQQTIQLLPIILRNVKLFVLIVMISAVFGAGATIFVLPHTYTAEVSILPSDSKQAGGGLSALLQGSLPMGLGGLGANDGKNAFFSEDIILSRTVAEKIVAKTHLDTFELYQKIKPEIRLLAVKNSIYFEQKRSPLVKMEVAWQTSYFPDEHSKRQAASISCLIANALPTVLDTMIREKNNSSAHRARVFIDRMIAENKAKLDSLYSLLENFQKKNKLVGLEEQTRAIVNSAVSSGAELAKAQTELTLLQQQFQPESPQIKLQKEKVNALREIYTRVQTGGESADKIFIPFDSVPSLSRSYIIMMRDLKIQEQLNAFLQSQRMQEYIEEERDVPALQVLDKALISPERSSPKLLIMVVLFTVAGGIIAFLVILFKEIRRGRTA